MQVLCKYYVDLNRYNEATALIIKGIVLTHRLLSMKRVTKILMHQINTDLIASNLSDAAARINLAEKLLSEKNVSFKVSLIINDQEIFKIRNFRI